MSFLEINNLDIQYKTRKETINASRDVTFNLERGEILGIVASLVLENLLWQML